VANDEPIGRSSVLVHHDEVRHPVGSAGRQQLLKLVVTAVQPLRIGYNESELLKKEGSI